METSERLKNLIARFVLKYNYWGYLFSRVRRHAESRLPSIMGVAPEQDGTICLYYNPALVDATDDVNLIKIIEHEGLHILNKHIPRLIRILSNEISDDNKKRKSNVWNIAADCAVNSQAKFKDDFKIAGEFWPLCLPEKYNMPNDKVTEWYYLELLKTKNNVKYEGRSDLGDHGKWLEHCKGVADLSALSRKIDQHVQRIIKESAKTFNKDRGKLPAHIAELIRGALMPPKAPYYQIIRKLVKGTRFSKFQSSPTRINRKRTYTFVLADDKNLPQISPFPGKMRDYTFDIAIVLDTSGSMSIEDIKEGLSGVRNIIEKDRYCRTTVIEADTVVEKEYVCKKIKDIQYKIKGRGGTTLGPGLFRAKEIGCDVCLVFTDGYTENINAYSRDKLPKKLIWVINKGGIIQNINKTGYIINI